MRNRVLKRLTLALLSACLSFPTAAQDITRSWNFDAEKAGAIAAGFTNEVGEWKILADGSSPTKPNVLAQLAKTSDPSSTLR